uniref:DUF4878 domain-containing protein n=1 Tax=Schlesneria paludicola TaxID=360056 RepID=A0A7C2K0W3_9PLAN
MDIRKSSPSDGSMAAQRPARSGQVKPAILLVILVVAVAVGIWLWMRPSTQPNVDAGRAIAESFLNLIREGHPDQAWESTTAEFKSAQGKEAFLRHVKPEKYLTQPLEFVSAQTVTVQNQPRSEYVFRSPDGKTIRIVLGREGSTWKVDRWTR